MLSTKKIVGICGAVLVSGGAAAALVLVPGASASGRTTTTTHVTAPATAAVGAPFAINISVTPDSGAGTPSGRIVVWGPTSVLCRTVLSGGSATCTMSESGAGKLPLQVRYLGDVNDLPSVASVSVTITGGTAGTPVFTTDSPPLTATAGGSYSYTFAASGTPAPAYSLTGAPPWMSINATSGQVTGTVPASATGSFFYSVTATNSAGSATVGPFTVSLGTGGGGGGGGTSATLLTSVSCPASVAAGGTWTCFVTVTNNGPGTAAGTALLVEMPALLPPASCSGGCSIALDNAQWNFGSLANGAVESVSVTFNAETPFKPLTLLIVKALAATTTPDPNPAAGDAVAHITLHT